MTDLFGLKLVKERPSEGKYTRLYTFGGYLWAETIEVDEDGEHYAYNGEDDAFNQSPNRIRDVKFLYAVEDK